MAGGGQLVADDLDQPGRPPAHHHQLVAVHPAPHLVADPDLGQRVAHRTETDGLVVAHDAGLAQRGGERLGRQRMHPGPLLGQHLRRRPAGLGVRAGVDPSQNASHASARAAKLG